MKLTKQDIAKALGTGLFALLLSYGIGITYAAWTAPAQVPPNGNVMAPINTGDTFQIKNGGLSLNSGGAESTVGLTVWGGLWLATTSSTFHNSLRLQVDGLVGATKYCDVTGANCFTAASTSAIIASGGGGGPVSTSTGGFGAWESKTTGTVYQALTDGFVVAMADGPSGSGYIYGYTDSSPAPSTAVMWSSDQWSDQKGGVTFPVRKNDYWKVTTTFWATVYWLPQTSGGSSGSSPVGTVSQFAGSSVPGGYLECNGTAVSRATFSALFAVIGTTYGAGDGSTTFNLPNLKGKIPVGMDTSQTEFDVLGETGGEKAHTLTVAEMPSHNHNSAQNGPGGGGVVVANTGNQSWVFPTSYTGSDQPHNNLQPYVVMKYIIKY